MRRQCLSASFGRCNFSTPIEAWAACGAVVAAAARASLLVCAVCAVEHSEAESRGRMCTVGVDFPRRHCSMSDCRNALGHLCYWVVAEVSACRQRQASDRSVTNHALGRYALQPSCTCCRD